MCQNKRRGNGLHCRAQIVEAQLKKGGCMKTPNQAESSPFVRCPSNLHLSASSSWRFEALQVTHWFPLPSLEFETNGKTATHHKTTVHARSAGRVANEQRTQKCRTVTVRCRMPAWLLVNVAAKPTTGHAWQEPWQSDARRRSTLTPGPDQVHARAFLTGRSTARLV